MKKNLFDSKPLKGDNLTYKMLATFLWEQKAVSLHRATSILFDAYVEDSRLQKERLNLIDRGLETQPLHFTDILDQAIMLSCFCIENLLKQMITYLNPDLIDNGKLSGILCDHDLFKLATEAKYDFTEDEIKYIECANVYITLGRYPIGKSKASTKGSVTYNKATLRIFDDLYNKLTEELKLRFHTRKNIITNE